MSKLTPQDIDALLPQTQCGLCGYGGCLPYAKALVTDEAGFHLCSPGGITTLKALAEKLHKDETPFIDEVKANSKPFSIAKVREDECIGCTKCIQACPVDAIIGSAKQMHVVIAADCTGCELCIPACPVDCIDLITVDEHLEINDEMREKNRHRYQKKLARLNDQNKTLTKMAKDKCLDDKPTVNKDNLEQKKNYIQAALARIQAKKMK